MTPSPDALPPEIHDASAWYGPAMLQDTRWLQHFTAAEIAEVEQATRRVAAGPDAAVARLTPADFPLPTLAPRLHALRDEVLNGRGFALLRGLPVQRWSLREAAIAFLGIGCHIGSARSQNAKGHILGHVKDMGLSSDDPNVRIYQTHERQTFHTDSADIVGLLCLQVAKSGGHSALVSSITIFNEMRKRRPDLLPHLFAPIETDRRGEVPVGEKPYFTIPTYNWHEGHLSAIYQRQYIESARRFADVAPLSPAQVEAFDLFDALSNDPALNFHMVLEPGDVQLVHNHTLLHDRTAFEDWAEPAKRRHLLRLWLAPQQARPLPPVFAQRYGSVTPGDRGGIIVPGTQLTVPFEAV
jgi:hypothetical protein